MVKRLLNEQRVIVSFPSYDGAGIYMIRNLTSGKVYIGSSKNILQRAKAHDQSFRHGTCNQKFLEDISKGDKFVCEVIEKCSKITLRELRDKEYYYVRKYNADSEGYNTAIVPTYDPKHYISNKKVLDWLNKEM